MKACLNQNNKSQKCSGISPSREIATIAHANITGSSSMKE